MPRLSLPSREWAISKLVLYSRKHCHLCEDMLSALEPLLQRFGADVSVRDVDADPILLDRFDELVPVLEADGVELSRYLLDEPRVQAFLESSGRAEPCEIG